MKNQIILFIEFAHLLNKKCVRHKHRFPLGFTVLFQYPLLEIYYADDHKTWSVRCNGVTYSNYKDEISFNVDEPGFDISLSKANNILKETVDEFEDIFGLRRRKLT